MPNDAKLGLILGVGLVVATAVVFFRKEPLDGKAPPTPPAVVPAESAGTEERHTSRQSTAQVTSGGPHRDALARRHVVEEGDTLYSLARRYYKNDAKFVDIFQANRATVRQPDRLTPGTVLVLPDLPDDEETSGRAP